MSTIMFRKSANIEIGADECGQDFAATSADVQAAFLLAMANEIESWNGSSSWHKQCQSIAMELIDDRETTGRIRSLLQVLVDSLPTMPVVEPPIELDTTNFTGESDQ